MNQVSLDKLKILKLTYLQENYADFCKIFGKNSNLATSVIDKIFEDEIEFRRAKSLERRIKESKIGNLKPMADFDWDWPKKIDRHLVERLLGLDFIDGARNAILIGSQGVGKSMIAKNIAHLAASKGMSSLFVSASDLTADLNAAQKIGIYRARQRRYLKPRLLIVDEIGYLSFDAQAADILFDVVTKRYEKSSIIFTTNLAFNDWGKIFPNATCIAALIDRFTHHCDIVSIEGESYRLKEANQQSKKRQQEKRK